MKPIKILHLETDPFYVELIHSTLVEAGIECEITAVETEEDFVSALARETPDIILADYILPLFDVLSALKIIRKEYPDIPFILVSGSIEEEYAVESLRRGATDYVLKTNLNQLVSVVTKALNEREEFLTHRQAEASIMRLKAAIEHSSDSIIITGADGIIEYVNPSFMENTGYRWDELIGNNPSILKSGIHDREFYDELWKTITAGNTWNGVLINRKKDGSLFTDESTISPIISEKGVISGYVAIKRDITESMEIESRLHRKQLLMRGLADIFLTYSDDRMFEKALDLILENLQSKDGLFAYIAENNDLIIPSLKGDVWEKCNVADKAFAFQHKNIAPKWARAIRGRKGFFVNEPVNVPEGHFDISNTMLAPLVFQDRAIGLLVIANKKSGYTEDNLTVLTELADYISPILDARLQRNRQEKMRLEAEQKLREYSQNLKQMVEEQTLDLNRALTEAEMRRKLLDAVIRHFAGGLMVSDTSDLILMMNRNAEIYLNSQFSDVQGKSVETLFPGKANWQVIRKKMTRQDPYTFEFTVMDPKLDKNRVIRAKVAGIYNKDNERTSNVTVLDDITHDREIEKLKTDFISITAHQLRTPLTSIQGFSEILLTENDVAPEEQRKFLTYINQQAVKLTSLIRDFLDLSLVEAETIFDLETSPCSAGDLINDMLPDLQHAYPKHAFKISGLDQPDEIVVNREMLEQVLNNLLSNAANYSTMGGQITISGKPLDGFYRLSVTDEGIGMTPEQVDKIFDKFYRVDSSDSAASSTGLGMSIVKHIVEKHGGKVQVKSSLGEGTTVFFTVPAHKKEGAGV